MLALDVILVHVPPLMGSFSLGWLHCQVLIGFDVALVLT